MIVPPTATTKSQQLLHQRPSYESWIHTLSMKTVLIPTYSTVADDKEDTITTTAATTTTTNDVENNNNGAANQNSTGHNQDQNHDYAIVNGIIAAPGGAHHVLVETIRMWRCLITNLSPNDDYDHNDDDDDDYDYCDDDDDCHNNNNDVHVFAPYIPMWKTHNDSGSGSGIGNSDDGNDELVMESNHLQIFESGAAAALMTSIGLAGILDPIVNRPMPTIEHGYETIPFSLFWEGSVHGGVWNSPYTLNSVSGISGYVLGKVYNYYDTYYMAAAATLGEGGGAAAQSALVKTATTLATSGTNNSDVTNKKDESDSSSSLSPSSTTTTSFVDAVPSTFGKPMPDLVPQWEI